MEADSELRLNYRCDPGGSIRVEILNQEGRAADKAVPLTGDALAGVASWQSGSAIGACADADCVARLHLDQAEVYAYEQQSPGR